MEKNLEKIFGFLGKVENLKSTLRYLHTKSGRRESTAEHSWRLALMSFVVAPELGLKLDVTKATQMAIVHDLAEAVTGDIDAIKIAENKITHDEKNKLEIEAMKQLAVALPDHLGQEIFKLWQEYEQAATPEARFIKALDKLETLTQIVEMGFARYDRPDLIPNYADRAVADFPELKVMLGIIKRKLKLEFDKGSIEWKEEYD